MSVEEMIGKSIQRCRKKKGLTQEQLAEKLSLSAHHLSAIERGVYGVKVDTLAKIIDCLDCTADDIFADTVKSGYKIKASRLSDEIVTLDPDEQSRIFDVVEAMIKTAKKK